MAWAVEGRLAPPGPKSIAVPEVETPDEKVVCSTVGSEASG